MKETSHIKRSLLRDERGAVIPIVAVSIVTLLAFSGFAIDVGRSFLVSNKMSNALDAALLAASKDATSSVVQENPEKLNAIVRDYFKANFPSGYLGTTIDESNITASFDENTGALTGNATGDVDLIFSGIYDLIPNASTESSTGIVVNSEVLREIGAKVEVALVMDNSYSMCYAEGTGAIWGNRPALDTSCTKYVAMVDAVSGLIEEVQDRIEQSNSPESAAHYAYIPYTHDVRVNGSMENFNGFCNQPADDDTVLPVLTGLRENPATILGIMRSHLPFAEGGTNTSTGMYWGWAALRSNSTGLFSGSSSHEKVPATIQDVRDLTATKAIILLTDGKNEYFNRNCNNPDYTILSGRPNTSSHDDSIADDRFAELCAGAKQEGIKVYTVAYNVPEGSSISTALESCGSPDSFYQATEVSQLKKAFEGIANDLIDVRITR